MRQTGLVPTEKKFETVDGYAMIDLDVPDADAGGRGDDTLRAKAHDLQLGVVRSGALLDLGPVLLRGAPARLRYREAEHLILVVKLQ